MTATAVRPTGVERLLGSDELIVSKTDAKGRITYANDVFCRMSAMPEEDLVGRPHNIVRHPDMPRAIFKYAWDTIQARQEIFAYVVNLAADGTHYWVFAHMTATGTAGGPITGYHSNRRAPARSAIAAVEPLYRRLREVERAHGSAREALAASTEAFHAALAQQGTTYEEFVWSVTP
ncbi:MAG: PAS domain-containing protein [Kineosporiaceae bacterium]